MYLRRPQRLRRPAATWWRSLRTENSTHTGPLAITSRQLHATDRSLLEDSAVDLDNECAERGADEMIRVKPAS